ncbi:hypothetical protein M569_04921, partial [Genlisea aurea]
CKTRTQSPAVLFPAPDSTPSYNALIFQAARLLSSPARFEASKLKILFRGDEVWRREKIVPRIYTLSHCDLTANLTLTISNIIHREQLEGWYNKDDVVAEWTEVDEKLFLNVHCHVSGPDSFWDMAAEFRYHIFSKELPLVLEALLYGDSELFRDHPGSMDGVVRVFFHSSIDKYNRTEYWGPLRDAAVGKGVERINGYSLAIMENSKFWDDPKSIFFALATTFLL